MISIGVYGQLHRSNTVHRAKKLPVPTVSVFWPQSLSGPFGESNILLLLPGFESQFLGRPACILFTTLTTLSRLLRRARFFTARNTARNLHFHRQTWADIIGVPVSLRKYAASIAGLDGVIIPTERLKTWTGVWLNFPLAKVSSWFANVNAMKRITWICNGLNWVKDKLQSLNEIKSPWKFAGSSKHCLTCMDSGSSVPCWQRPITGCYPEPAEPILRFHTLSVQCL